METCCHHRFSMLRHLASLSSIISLWRLLVLIITTVFNSPNGVCWYGSAYLSSITTSQTNILISRYTWGKGERKKTHVQRETSVHMIAAQRVTGEFPIDISIIPKFLAQMHLCVQCQRLRTSYSSHRIQSPLQPCKLRRIHLPSQLIYLV